MTVFGFEKGRKKSKQGKRIVKEEHEGIQYKTRCLSKSKQKEKKAKQGKSVIIAREAVIQCPTNYLMHEVRILSYFWNSLMDGLNFNLYSIKTCSYFLFIFSSKVPKKTDPEKWFHTHES